jgi:hypothetical protein
MFTKDDIITTDKFLHTFPNIYHKTDVIVQKGPIIRRGKIMYPPPKNETILISGHSDYGVTNELVDYYNPNLWFTVNKQTSLPNVRSLPLGITNDSGESVLHYIYGNLDCMIQVMSEPKDYKNLVYMNFNIQTFPQERQSVFDMFSNKTWVTVGNIENSIPGRTRFLGEIRNHTFVLCPRGNGVDTHRMWETLYMGSIPIVKRDIAMDDFSDLPICFINDWTEVTPEFLNTEKLRIENGNWNMDKLKMSYWISAIQSESVYRQ